MNLITYQNPFSKNYYFHKIKGYFVVAQTTVYYEKQFTNTFVGMFGNVKDICVWTLFKKPQLHGLFFIHERVVKMAFRHMYLVLKGSCYFMVNDSL